MKKNSDLVLIVDDEIQIRRLLKVALESHKFQVVEAITKEKGLEISMSQRPNCMILDLGLPDGDGLDLLKMVREWSKVPIIILSARNDEETIIKALDLGADDYLTKPFAVGELLARIRVCLRRANPQDETTLFKNGDLEVDFNKRLVSFKGEALKLTSTEYDLLKLLVLHAGKVLTHRQILKEIWGPNFVEHTQYLRVYIGHLRQKIEEDPARPKILLTESGVGYRLKILDLV